MSRPRSASGGRDAERRVDVRCHFLGAGEPLLGQAARWFDREFGTATDLDLGDTLVLVSGRRGARLILHHLVERSQRRLFFPPRLATVGVVAELLQPPVIELAHPIEELAVRRAVLLEAPDEEVRTAFGHRPEAGDHAAWIHLAEQCRAVDRELAFGGWAASGACAALESAQVFGERQDEEMPRWNALCSLLEACEGELELRHRQSRWLHLRRAARTRCDRNLWDRPYRRVVLVGLTELQRSVRDVLFKSGLEIHSLIQAEPSEEADHDRWGRPSGPVWESNRTVPERVVVADDPGEQAEFAARATRLLLQPAATDPSPVQRPPVVVAALDPALARAVQDELTAVGVPSHGVLGRRVAGSQPVVLLRLLSLYLEQRSLQDLGELLRQPVVDEWLRSDDAGRVLTDRSRDLLWELDAWRRASFATGLARLPARGSDEVTEVNPDLLGTLREIDRAFERLLPIGQSSARSAAHRLASALRRLFAHDQARPVPAECGEALRFLGDQLTSVPAIPGSEHWTVGELLELVERVARDAELDLALERGPELDFEPSETGEGSEEQSSTGWWPRDGSGRVAVEVVGWLDVCHDDAETVVLLGANEGLLPARVSPDPFLTSAVRTELGLASDAGRLVRDRYLLDRLLASRRSVVCVAGRVGGTGEPLLPSRLLLPAEGRELAEAVTDFFGGGESDADPIIGPDTAAGPSPAWSLHYSVPLPDDEVALPNPVPVTGLKTYLACPYRFYLRHMLRLRPYPETGLELDGAQFGDLAHAVLDHWARSRAELTRDAEGLAALLVELLEERVKSRFGSSPPVALRVQVEQLRQRLVRFAGWQAEAEHEGWRVMPEFVERQLRKRVELSDGRFVEVVGRVDRIDRHSATGRWRLVDYKTADTAKSPQATHRRGDDWVDLQLPVYRHLLLEELGGDGELGYVALAKSSKRPMWLPADWSRSELEDAWLCADRVLRSILDRDFWPPGDPPNFDDGLGWIAGDGMPRHEVLRSAAEGQKPVRTTSSDDWSQSEFGEW